MLAGDEDGHADEGAIEVQPCADCGEEHVCNDDGLCAVCARSPAMTERGNR